VSAPDVPATSGTARIRGRRPFTPHHLTNADLHSHSSVSDGTLAPAALAALAAAEGVELFALTDHDETAGLAEARDAALDHGMAFLAGVEVSVTFLGETVHVVGLGIDPRHEALAAGLAATRAGREARARRMGESLAKAGICGAFEGALAHAGNPALVARTHFARFLVEAGHASDTHAVFRRFLVEGKPGFVPHTWAKLGEAIGWIRGAGGVAVLAHPARYRFTPNEDWALFHEFTGLGGQAVEVMTGSHSEAERRRYADTAVEFGLAASRGSDFHDPLESRTRPGALPPLPGRLDPVWLRLASRIQA
jgi:predicted metal-dependent phosphoesterase TrpH